MVELAATLFVVWMLGPLVLCILAASFLGIMAVTGKAYAWLDANYKNIWIGFSTCWIFTCAFIAYTVWEEFQKLGLAARSRFPSGLENTIAFWIVAGLSGWLFGVAMAYRNKPRNSAGRVKT